MCENFFGFAQKNICLSEMKQSKNDLKQMQIQRQETQQSYNIAEMEIIICDE